MLKAFKTTTTQWKTTVPWGKDKFQGMTDEQIYFTEHVTFDLVPEPIPPLNLIPDGWIVPPLPPTHEYPALCLSLGFDISVYPAWYFLGANPFNISGFPNNDAGFGIRGPIYRVPSEYPDSDYLMHDTDHYIVIEKAIPGGAFLYPQLMIGALLWHMLSGGRVWHP